MPNLINDTVNKRISRNSENSISVKEDSGKFSYHFVGVGGIGMSAIAQVLNEWGHAVSGSDRNFDKQITPDLFSKLRSQGISLHHQDGSSVTEKTDYVVVSSAIEKDNPDIKKAPLLNRIIIKRADLLAEMFNRKYGIAIGGTNGKTTVSCMVGYILDQAGLSPTVIVGGCIKNYVNTISLGNAKTGASDIISIEADESDGSIVLYTPKISVLTSLSKDHKTIDIVAEMFKTFSRKTSGSLILNVDCPNLNRVNFDHENILTYGINNSADIRPKNIVCKPFQSTFDLDGQFFEINLPGMYNVSNTLAAIAVARSLNIKDDQTAAALRQFKGVQRRMDIVGDINGVKVIDDYAHNPEKVMAAINAVKLGCKRVIAVFQPHGYGPTSFMKEEFIDAFIKALSFHDILYMPEIYYAGGTADMSISSADIINRVRAAGKNAFFIKERDNIIPEIKKQHNTGDCILVMGARDNTLTDFCQKIVRSL